MTARWLVVLFTAAALVATPVVIGTRQPRLLISRPSSSPGASGTRQMSDGLGTSRPPGRCRFLTTSRSPRWPKCRARTPTKSLVAYRRRLAGRPDPGHRRGRPIPTAGIHHSLGLRIADRDVLTGFQDSAADASDLLPRPLHVGLCRALVTTGHHDRISRKLAVCNGRTWTHVLDDDVRAPDRAGVDGHYLIRRRPDGWPQWTGRSHRRRSGDAAGRCPGSAARTR